MTRSEKKAKELVFGFYKIIGLEGFGYDCNPIDVIDNGLHKIAQLRSKECALRCVDEITKIAHIEDKDYYDELIEEIKKL